MPLSRAMPRILVGLAALAVFVGAAASAWSQSSTARAPRDIRFGMVDMVVQRVEPEISQEEIFTAAQAQLDRETMCFAWPTIWLDPSERRRREYIVRYDLMQRDWGADVAERARARMQDFIDMGLLTQVHRPENGVGVVAYHLTSLGYQNLRGSISSGRMSFCMPSERRVAEILETQIGEYACGTLRVRFRHVADAWPSWARTQDSRTRISETWAPLGEAGEGSVSMSRQWFSREPTDGRENGQLRSLCYDAETRQVQGEDMELYPAPAP